MSEPTRLRSMRRHGMFLWAGSLLALASGTANAQGNLGFLKDTPIAYFQPDDVKLMRAAAAEVLKSAKDGTRKDWNNPATGNGGAITLMTQFTAADGRTCNQLRVENHAKTMDNASIMSVCKSADGQWKADAAKPPTT